MFGKHADIYKKVLTTIQINRKVIKGVQSIMSVLFIQSVSLTGVTGLQFYFNEKNVLAQSAATKHLIFRQLLEPPSNPTSQQTKVTSYFL